jgi:hypothetical protein
VTRLNAKIKLNCYDFEILWFVVESKGFERTKLWLNFHYIFCFTNVLYFMTLKYYGFHYSLCLTDIMKKKKKLIKENINGHRLRNCCQWPNCF